MAEQINRRRFLEAVGAGAVAFTLPAVGWAGADSKTVKLPEEWIDPPSEFSQAPFWFWNDELSEAELLRQIEDFKAHGVQAFLI
ncbi:MAG: hypothetical protein EHM35_05200, partial [Planctomycetaceae bacterium]